MDLLGISATDISLGFLSLFLRKRVVVFIYDRNALCARLI